MNMSNWLTVRLCVLSFIFTNFFLGLSPLFGECQINCVSSLELSLDQTGSVIVSPNLFIIDSDNCIGEKELLITTDNGQLIEDNTLNCTHNGQTFIAKITDSDTQANCWSSLSVTDNSPPKIIDCLDHYIYCNSSIPISEIGNPTFEDNCGTDILSYYSDEVTDQLCDPSIIKIINRTWTVSDIHGNQATPCTQQIFFEPIENAEIQLPPNLIIENCANPDSSPNETGFPTYDNVSIDNSICQYNVSYTDVTTPICSNSFKIFRTWIILDWCSNEETIHNQIIEVVDTEAPEINCNGDTLIYFVNAQHECFADVSIIEVNTIDNCSEFSISYEWAFENLAAQVPIGIYPITAIASDECNNQSTCDFFIQILDQQAPIAICESDLVVSLDEFGNYILEATFLNASSTDNCGISDYQISVGEAFGPNVILTCEQLNNPVTTSLMVIDESGNTSVCSATITVIDGTLPTIECPADITIKCDEDQTDLSVTGNALASDNCEEYTPTFEDVNDLNICNAGTINRTFSVFENGSTISCIQLITLEIDSPAVVFPLDITVNCGASNDLSIVGEPVITAMCPGFLVDKNDTVDQDSSCNLITTRIWKVIDNCLDTIYKSEQIITEIDTLPPILIESAKNVIIDCMQGDLDSLNNWLLSNGGAIAIDNCTEAIWTNNFENFDFLCANTGSTSVIFTATDQCGNAVSTNANFIIIDTIGPSFLQLPIDMTMTCEANIQQEIDDYLLTNGGAIVFEQCSEVQVVSELINPIESLCSSYEVITTATDQCGLSITTISTITIVDDTPPEILMTPSDIQVSCESGNIEEQIDAWISSHGGAVATDLCGEVIWINDFDQTIPQCGTAIQITFTATDECDNSISVSATYTVIDNFAPIIIDPAMDMTYECDGFGNEIDINNYLDNNGFANVTDVCSNIVWSNDFIKIDSICGGTGTSLVNFTATDVCGNQTVTTGLITIIDTTPPDVLIPIEEFVVECDGFGNVLEFNTWVQANGNIAVEDICSEVEFTFDFNSLIKTCANAGSVFTVFVAADECNNKTNLITNFIIEDTTPPLVSCPEDLTVIDENLDCIENIILPPTTATDLCNGNLFFSYEIDYDSNGTIDIVNNGTNTPNNYAIGIHTINYFVEDECGNIGACQQIVEVVDGTGSELNCVETFFLGIDETGIATLTPESIGMTSNCNEGTGSLSQTSFSCDDCGINEITFTLTDIFGNATTCTSNVFVCDLDNNCSDCIPCSGLAVGGLISTENNIPLSNVDINIEGYQTMLQTNSSGNYYFEGSINNHYLIEPYKNDDVTNGVTTLDLIAIQKHILGIAYLDSPYQKIAADANNSGSITTLDIVDIQRVILQIDDVFSNNTSWRFLESDFEFINYNNPFTSTFPELIAINGLTSPQVNSDFVAIKIGDVNQTYLGNASNVNTRNTHIIPLKIKDQIVQKNEVIDIKIEVQESVEIEGYQISLAFDPTLFEFLQVNQFGLDDMTIDNFGFSKIDEGILLVNWTPSKPMMLSAPENYLFKLQLKAKKKTQLLDNIWIQENPIVNEVYVYNKNKKTEVQKFGILIQQNDTASTSSKTHFFQNAPNPFTASTQIKFYLPEQMMVDLNIYDATGKKTWSLSRLFSPGNNEITIHADELGPDGIYLCSLNTAFGNGIIKLIHISKF